MIGNLTVGIQDFVIPAPLGDFQSIATVTVGSGGSSSISFTSIPSSFQHLQLRGIAKDSRSGVSYSNLYMTFNGDTGNNYSWHYLYGDPRPYTESAAGTTQSSILIQGNTGTAAPTTNDKFGVFVIDILDYASVNKFKTVRSLSGHHVNTGGNSGVNGVVVMTSGRWGDADDAIDEITLTPLTSPFTEFTQFALYGIKG